MRPQDATALAQLAEPLRSRLHALLQAAKGKVWIVSGRRSIEEQVQLRREHCGPTSYDIWQRPSSQCSPPTAVPGRSKHNSGLAADLRGDLNMAADLGRRFGLHTPVSGEDWHYESNPVAAVDLSGIPLPPLPDLPGNPIDDVIDVGGGIAGGIGGAVEDAVSSALGALVEPLLEGARRMVLVGVLVAGGVALVVMGGIRGTQPLRRDLP